MSGQKTKGRHGVRRRTDEDWVEELSRVHRIRAAADVAVKEGDRGQDWGAAVRASADALVLLLAVSDAGEAEAIAAARARLRGIAIG